MSLFHAEIRFGKAFVFSVVIGTIVGVYGGHLCGEHIGNELMSREKTATFDSRLNGKTTEIGLREEG